MGFFAAEFVPADLIATWEKSPEWRCITIVCAFKVIRTCGAAAQFTSVIVPTIE